MSYVLGYFIADGCLGRRKDRKEGYFFNITSKDRAHLRKIKKVMNSRHKIHRKANSFSKERKYSFIQISCREICKDLLNIGIRPRKTYTLNPIKVPDKYFPDFVRGFFDGDGTVYIHKVNGVSQIKANFISHRLEFFKQFNKQLCRNLDIPEKTIHKELPRRKDQSLVRYSIYFYIDDCKKLFSFMYANKSSLYLRRKYNVFKKWEGINRRHYIKKSYPSKIGWHLNTKIAV